MGKGLSATLEDYLETIYCLEEKNRVARPRDISEAQGVARSTVTAALQSLSEKGLINYEPYELITLTEEGRKTAQRLDYRHRIIRDFLENILRIDPERADETACGMEHAVGRDVLERFTCFLAFMRRCSADGTRCLEQFRDFIEQHTGPEGCHECLENYVEELHAEAGK
jgi:DtxR family Mn-dependent transcriptional regulator